MVNSIALALCVIGFAETAVFAVTSNELHRTASFIGVIMALQGVGAIIGGPLSAPAIRRIGERWTAGLGLAIVALGALFFEGGSLTMVLIGAALFGFALPPIIVGAYTLLQLRTPAELQGRAYSAFDLVGSFPQTISIALGASLITVLGYHGELTIIAIVVAISAIYLLLPVRGEPNFGPLQPDQDISVELPEGSLGPLYERIEFPGGAVRDEAHEQ